ncbi:MAG: hypothetical protein NWS06_03410 [Candidatus Nanopelagicales bacterium]|jgi:ATP-dependent exoDNAse (exonuclease V) alpha subunit|nr:hypothetical protein [Candidatus Nanopelagicales bacterium]MDP4667045.1 hypothetical protein [Candidatus Nanopelagicales bacterium]MDP4895959.1 hypothetical protein [Candidatus Nanopelagicales bacterium]MDP5050717.1 hypothetical protein [Candidatus Nanopelagicales bacterium]
MSEDLTNRLVVAVIEQHETKIWPTNAVKGTKPEVIHPLSSSHHVSEAQHHTGHESEQANKTYFEEISKSLESAGEILLVGHGHGKSNAVLKFIQHLERYHANVAQKVVGSLDINLPALTDGELLAAARAWFDEPIHQR